MRMVKVTSIAGGKTYDQWVNPDHVVSVTGDYSDRNICHMVLTTFKDGEFLTLPYPADIVANTMVLGGKNAVSRA